MKHVNLQILKDNGINVPSFMVVDTKSNIDLSFSAAEKFAVRSSFIHEDGDSSFAGQFDTLLNVERNNIDAAVEQVINSYNNESVQQYKNIKNIQNINEGSVIIQEMLSPELSGVIFTANPQGIINETVIVVGEGLGNNIVEDKVDTTQYFYNQDDGIYYYEQTKESPILAEELLKKLIDISGKIKTIFNQEMDIEFAIQNNEVFVLQARPITTLNMDNIIILDNSNIVESYPGISLPLTQSFVKEVYYEIFKNCLNRISKNDKIVEEMDDQLRNMVDVVNGRIYYRISNWYSVLNLLPFSDKIIPIWQDMLGVNNKYIQNIDVEVPKKTKLTITCGFFHYLNKIPKLMDELNKNFDRFYNESYELTWKSENIEELLDIYQKIKKIALEDWDLTLINDMYTFIYTYLAGEENKKYLSDIQNIESMKPIIEFNKLVQEYINYKEISKKNPDRKFNFGLLGERTEVAEKYAQYMSMCNNYIDKYGSRCLGELKLETITYTVNSELLHQLIEKKAENFEEHFNDIKNDKNISNSKNNNVFVSRAKTGIKNREISRLNRSRLFDIARRIFLNIGTVLFFEKKIDAQTDIFYLHIDEITRPDIKEIINRRKEEIASYESIPAYSRLVFSEKIINKHINNSVNDILNKPNELKGTATSEGIITGEVLVIDNPNLSIDTTGKILVTKTTDPGWVFLIDKAAGIIAEKGSLLSHTAIITRELHKPSIVNVKDCTKILKTGDIIEMDAINGIIKIL